MDATHNRFFLEDLDNALAGRPLNVYTPYKTWADSLYTLRTSPLAKQAVKYHVSHLKGISEHKHALWPFPTPRLDVSPERADIDGHVITYSAPDLLRLREKYPQLTAPIVIKAALALLTIYHTNHTHAIFLSLEANRARFPFIPESYSSVGEFDHADVPGPTFSGILNMIAYQPHETVIEYLSRIREYQVEQTKHGSVPWHEVLRELDCLDVFPATAESLMFNWMPGLGAQVSGGQNAYSHFKLVQTFIRVRMGMLVNAGTFGPNGSDVVFLLQGALTNMSTAWSVLFAEKLKKISLWLAAPKSWSKPVGQFIECV